MKKFKKEEFLPDLREIRKMFDADRDKYSEKYIRQHAGEDASKDIPTSEQSTPSPFEQELQHAASSLATKITAKFKGALEVLDARIKAETALLDRKHQDELNRIESLYLVESDIHQNNFGLNDAHKQYQVADERYNSKYTELGRAPIVYVPHWLYIIFATLIFLGEIPLNALVFQIFGENQVMTWVMAFIIGLAVPLTAHFIGIKVREHEGGISWPNLIKGGVTFALVTAALYGLSVMRQTYLGEFKEELGLTDVLVESSFQFFWLNMAVFCAAIVVAYLSHDTVPGYQECETKRNKKKRLVERREKQRVKELVRLGRQKVEAMQDANKEYQDGMVAVIMLKGFYDQILKEGQQFEKQCLERLQHNLATYRHENLRVREGTVSPPSFQNNLAIDLELQTMKEKLINDEAAVA